MAEEKSTFALLFGNRGFFPARHLAAARRELPEALKRLGHEALMLDPKETRHGGVETPQEARRFAAFLREHRGRYQGVILSLPNFGDENGAAIALAEAGVPVFIQAYPDELEAMDPASRRDAFCGKLSIMDVLRQNDIPFTVRKPHVVSPLSEGFAENAAFFDRVCRVVAGVRGMRVGQIGARTTPFKTVRIDEVALQKRGITVETFDLSDVFERMRRLKPSDPACRAKMEHLQGLAAWNGVPAAAADNLVRLGVVLDAMIEENELDAVSVRCWTEIQQQFGISPCLITGDLMGRGLPAACEVDTGSAVAMHVLGLASGEPAMILDWNNNYEEEEQKCILFHCGNVPASMMAHPGRISDHEILKASIGAGHGFGCVAGRIAPMEFTFGNLLTDSGTVKMYLGQGRFTQDPIPASFFGCAGVADIPALQEVLLFLGSEGHRHHVALTPGQVEEAAGEALSNYLGFQVSRPQRQVAAR